MVLLFSCEWDTGGADQRASQIRFCGLVITASPSIPSCVALSAVQDTPEHQQATLVLLVATRSKRPCSPLPPQPVTWSRQMEDAGGDRFCDQTSACRPALHRSHNRSTPLMLIITSTPNPVAHRPKTTRWCPCLLRAGPRSPAATQSTSPSSTS